MKTKLLIASAAVAMCMASGISASAQAPYGAGMPGIAISGSCDASVLPAKATEFLSRHFKDNPVRKCKHDYLEAVYEVKLTDGTEIEFANDGTVVEIEAAKKRRLPDRLLRDILPSKTYKYLKDNGLTDDVEGVDYVKGKVVEVDLAIKGPDTMIFDLDGNFLVVAD